VPIYEYACAKCSHEFEELVFDRDAVIKCPECGSKKTKKLLSVFAHKSDSGFTSSAGGDSCGGCSASTCSGCSSK
jgi:putative FmdB family regulatory protein